MALIKCKECGSKVSTEAISCPSCGSVKFNKSLIGNRPSKWKAVGLLFLGVVFIGALMQPKKEASQSEDTGATQQASPVVEKVEPKVETTCAQDYTLCSDNTELANNYQGMTKAKVACRMKLEDSVKYGQPDLPFFSFGSFTTGTNGPKLGYIQIAEDRAKIQNGFGAMMRVLVRCVYNLKDQEVELLRINDDVAYIKPDQQPKSTVEKQVAPASSTEEANKKETTTSPAKANPDKLASTAPDCIALIRVAAMAEDYVHQCHQKSGISDAAMNHYSRSSCARLVKPEEVSLTRKQVQSDTASSLVKDGQESYCKEAAEFYQDKAELFGLN